MGMSSEKNGQGKRFIVASVAIAIAVTVAAGIWLWHAPLLSTIVADETTAAPSVVTSVSSVTPDASESTADLVGGDITRIGNDKGDPSVAEPADYRMNDFRKPVPTTLKGARVISVSDAEEVYAGKQAVFLDVYPSPPKPPNLPEGTIWRERKHETIKGALWMPNVGYGVLSKSFEEYFRAGLKAVAGDDKAKPLVFFCLRDCWMSWNAAKRAVEWGYTNVIWFPEGVDGWREFNNETEKTTAMKIAG